MQLPLKKKKYLVFKKKNHLKKLKFRVSPKSRINWPVKIDNKY